MESLGDASSWQVMLERFVRENNAQEKKKLLYGLGTVDICKFVNDKICIFFSC